MTGLLNDGRGLHGDGRGLPVKPEIPPLPSSAIAQYKMGEGSGTTVGDSIGTADGTLSGATWITGLYRESHAVNGDGTDDYGTIPDTVMERIPFTFAFVISDWTETDTSDPYRWGNQETDNGNYDMPIQFNRGSAGDFRLFIAPPSFSNTVSVQSDGGYLNDGDPHSVVISVPSGSTPRFYVDGSEVTYAERTGSHSSTPAFGADYHFLAGFSDGSNSDTWHMNCTADNIVVADAAWSQSEAQDYHDRQPWS